MPRAFRFCPFVGIDGTWLETNDGARIATEQDMNWFWRHAEPELDRLTLDMCAGDRREGKDVPDWLLKAELAAFHRTRKRNQKRSAA